jgi:hypothetical protein
MIVLMASDVDGSRKKGKELPVSHDTREYIE